MVNAASEAEFAKPGVAHVDRLARGARSAPSPAAAPRRLIIIRRGPRRAIARAPSAAPHRMSAMESVTMESATAGDVGTAAPAAGAGRSGHADARRVPRARAREQGESG